MTVWSGFISSKLSYRISSKILSYHDFLLYSSIFFYYSLAVNYLIKWKINTKEWLTVHKSLIRSLEYSLRLLNNIILYLN